MSEATKNSILPQRWTSPCWNHCTHKYSALTQLPWRVFCKKGCGADGDMWEECVDSCDHICYKDPVFKDQKWSAYIDRSPGVPSCSEECFHACVSGCGFKFDVPEKTVEECQPNRPKPPPPPPTAKKPPAEHLATQAPSDDDDIPSISA